MQEDLARARGRADDLKAYGEDEPGDHGPGDSLDVEPSHGTDKGKGRDLRL